MLRREFLASAALPLAAAKPRSAYFERVRTFADTLLACGLDRQGALETPAWAGVIDTRDWSAPRKGVAAPPGIRESDRALGGANLYHDAVTLRVFHALSAVSGDPRYARAARDYMAWFLRACRSRETGLLAWGEHLYYDFFTDAVARERRHHELLEWTPPWDLLWEVDREAVAAAIAGLRFHHYEDRPGALFNRHASWEKAEFQKPGGQPWIKHSGLYAYSWAFLHKRAPDAKWLAWARGDGSLYWDRRNRSTNLTLSCIDDPREGSKLSGSGQFLLAYWLRKAAVEAPAEREFRERALALVKGWERWAWREERGGYAAGLKLDGAPAGDGLMPAWHFAYGESSLLPFGRVAAYFAKVDGDEQMRRAARRVAAIAARTPVPENASVEALGFALMLALDLDDETAARRYADLACERFWRGSGGQGLFARLPGDPYYESKTGVGDLLAGLLRLDARLAGRALPGDWTF
jgi:hypothetical protein